MHRRLVCTVYLCVPSLVCSGLVPLSLSRSSSDGSDTSSPTHAQADVSAPVVTSSTPAATSTATPSTQTQAAPPKPESAATATTATTHAHAHGVVSPWAQSGPLPARSHSSGFARLIASSPISLDERSKGAQSTSSEPKAAVCSCFLLRS